MGNNGSQGCWTNYHYNCNGCGVFVTRRSDHVHIFRDRGKREDLLCGDCHLLVAAAATVLLTAFEAAGITTSAAEIAGMSKAGLIGVLLPQKLPL